MIESYMKSVHLTETPEELKEGGEVDRSAINGLQFGINNLLL